MALFTKESAPVEAEQTVALAAEITLISRGTKVQGDLESQAQMHIDGQVNGQISSQETVTIGKDGKVYGNISAKKLVINGFFEGTADCDTVEIHQHGQVTGKLVSAQLMIEPQARFEGESRLKSENLAKAKESDKEKFHSAAAGSTSEKKKAVA